MTLSADLAPVIVFCYNRPQHLRQTIEALKGNTLAAQTRLILFSDGPKTNDEYSVVSEVRSYIHTISGFKHVEIIESEDNKGLAASVINGVTQVIEKYTKVIVLEDDMICTSDFLTFMNKALLVYGLRKDIFSVTGYSPPVPIPKDYKEDLYLAPRASSWGWGTWIDRWDKADWEVEDFNTFKNNSDKIKKFTEGGEDLWPMLYKQQKGVIDSWAIRWTYCQFKNNAFGVYPIKSKIKNIGTDGSGTNFTFKTDYYDNELSAIQTFVNIHIKPSNQIINLFKKYYHIPLAVKLKNFIIYRI